jgi:predicted RNA-binding Zn-ribbon protein involved in translation (DUF1610 family)
MNLNSNKTLLKQVGNPFCEDCLVDLTVRVENSNDESFTVYWECPNCHKQWIFECDKNGEVKTTKKIENI